MEHRGKIIADAKKKGFYGWAVVAGAGLRLFSQTGTLTYSLSVFLPTICEHFNWTRAAVSGAVSLRGMLMGILGPLAGIMIGKFGARKMLICTIITGAIGIAAMYTINEIWQVYLFYGVIVGAALGLGGTLGITTLVNNWFIRKRTIAMAIALIGGGLSGMVFPLIIVWLISKVDWRPTFPILGAIALLLGAVISGLIIRNKPEDMDQVPDGTTAEAEKGKEESTAPPLKVYQTPVDWETKQAMRQPTTWIIIFSSMASGFATAVLQTHQVAYLQDIGFSEVASASALGLITGLAIIGHLIVGALSSRMEVRHMAILCSVIRVVAVIILMNAATLPMVYLYSSLLGIAMGGTIVIRPSFIGAYYGRTNFAQISGWMMPFNLVSMALGPILAGFIYDTTGTYQIAFIIMLVLTVVGGAGYFFARPPKPPVTDQPSTLQA
jgi:MFS family permease